MIYSAGNASAIAGELGTLVTPGMQYDAGEAKVVGELTKTQVTVGDIKYGAGNAKEAVKPILDTIKPTKVKVISFKPDGGFGEMKDVKVALNDKFKVPACRFYPPKDKVFKNWKYETSKTANPGDVIEITAEGTLELTAVWETPSKK